MRMASYRDYKARVKSEMNLCLPHRLTPMNVMALVRALSTTYKIGDSCISQMYFPIHSLFMYMYLSKFSNISYISLL